MLEVLHLNGYKEGQPYLGSELEWKYSDSYHKNIKRGTNPIISESKEILEIYRLIFIKRQNETKLFYVLNNSSKEEIEQKSLNYWNDSKVSIGFEFD